jgi:signal transduction histidine kinase/CheY-like chemotaxis protein
MVLILGLAFFSLPESRAATSVILSGHILVCSSSLLLRWKKTVTPSVTTFMILGTFQILVATYLTGSIISPVVYSYPVLVVFASILLEFRTGIWIAAILLLGSMIIWIPSYAEYQVLTNHAPLHIRLLTLAWSLAATIAVAWLYSIESRRTQEELELANIEKDRFVAYLSHELRNPLTVILGASELLSFSEDDPRRIKLVNSLQRSAIGMTQVLDDVLDISKADAGMLDLKLQPIKVHSILEGMITEFAPLAETNGITLQLVSIKNRNVIADPKRLEQVLRNLLNNSLKFTSEGGHVTLRVTDEEKRLIFEVSDTGIGIDESNLKSILEPFRQAASGNSNGTGLGLPICCRLLERMNSKLEVKSQIGIGSCFNFSLPITSNSKVLGISKKLPPLELSDNQDINLIDFTILLADDNDEARRILHSLLEALGCKVEIARNGIEALEKIENHKFNAALLDIQMPKLDGIKTAKELHQRFKSGRLNRFNLMAVSGNHSALSNYERELFDIVLSKPVGINELRDCLVKVATEIKSEMPTCKT